MKIHNRIILIAKIFAVALSVISLVVSAGTLKKITERSGKHYWSYKTVHFDIPQNEELSYDRSDVVYCDNIQTNMYKITVASQAGTHKIHNNHGYRKIIDVPKGTWMGLLTLPVYDF